MAESALQDAGHADRMDGIYRWQRHIYDATRKYFLFGRDRLIAGLALEQGGSVLELGCGTGRNLALIGRHWPKAQLAGLDISEEMLRSAHQKLGAKAQLVRGDARRVDAAAFAQPRFAKLQFDRVVLSYALSMIPGWDECLAQGVDLLSVGGSLHIVDFGDGAGLPVMARKGLNTWLARFDVTPRHDMVERAQALAAERGLALEIQHGAFRYYQHLILTRPA
jgi:S-adenosylmethionine-diacylgycerolhomoserine-N-methlytransferase